jgi:hypothetical protein
VFCLGALSMLVFLELSEATVLRRPATFVRATIAFMNVRKIFFAFHRGAFERIRWNRHGVGSEVT